MKWSSVWHFLTLFVGIIGVAAAVTSWFIGDRTLLGFGAEELARKSALLISIAIWLALTALIHISKEEDSKD